MIYNFSNISKLQKVNLNRFFNLNLNLNININKINNNEI